MSIPSDGELIVRIVNGEREAYALLVERYERLARASASCIVRDRHIADDVVQEAFVAAFEALGSLRDRSRFGGWLLGIVRRRAARAIRQRRRSPALAVDGRRVESDSNGRSPPESLELLELVERLPDRERVLIGLRHFEGHTMQEIAGITGRPVGTVTKQLSRAHQRLRTWMQEEECQ